MSDVLERLSSQAVDVDQQSSFGFSISPQVLDTFGAIDSLAEYYQWKMMGLLIRDEHTKHVIEFSTSTVQLKNTR